MRGRKAADPSRAAGPPKRVDDLDASNPKWLSMKPILKVMNEALTAAGKQ
jgi:hypothetical protein